MPFDRLPTTQKDKRELIVDYLLSCHNPFQRTQVSIMNALRISQATLVRYLAELKGKGLVVEKPFGTAVIYEILYDRAITNGFGVKHAIFDLATYLAVKGQPTNQGWTGKVFKFGDMVYIYAKHQSGFVFGFPICDEDWKDLVQALTFGLNFEALITAIANYFRKS